MARGPSPRGDASRRSSRDEAAAAAAAAPWLQEADEEPDRGSATLIGRSTIWVILLGLLLLVSLVAAGVFMVARRGPADIDALPPGAEIPLLRDPGPWKVAPEGPGVEGLRVEGQDQLLFGTGVGADPEARIALDALPEEPMSREPGTPAQAPPTNLLPDGLGGDDAAETRAPPPPPPPPSARPQPEVTVVPKAAPAPPVAVAQAPRPATDTAASLVQLGAFSSESRARAAWKDMADRFAYLGGLTPRIQATTVDGRTLYRLRTDTGSPEAAREICGRLKVAGESCAMVANPLAN